MLLKSKKTWLSVLAILACALLTFGVLSIFIDKSVKAEEGTIDTATQAIILDEYQIGEKVDIPSASNVKITYEGVEKPATEVYLYTPNGDTLIVSSYVFDIAGDYKVVYSATFDNVLVEAEKNIRVYAKTYSAQQTIVEEIDTYSVLQEGDTEKTLVQEDALKVSIPRSDVFNWGQAINLNETKLDTPIISFLPYQFAALKKVDEKIPKQAENILVRITDAYDPNNYVTIELEYVLSGLSGKRGDPNQMPGYTAGATYQGMISMDTNLGREIYDGKIMTFTDPDLTDGEVSKRYFVTHEMFPGTPCKGEVTPDGAMIQLYFDVETNQVRVSQKTASTVYDKALIMDLDTKTVFRDNAFKGFTTGEVYLSIFADDYSFGTNYVEMEIQSIGGVSGEDLYSPNAIDDKAPVINIDVTDKQIDNGLFCALNKNVNILPYEVYDVNLKDTGVKVSYMGANVTVYGGNVFKPNQLGDYEVTYSASDTFGNVTTKTLIYKVIDCASNNHSMFDVQLNGNQIASNILSGTTITLPEYSITSRNKFVDVNIYAKVEGDSTYKVDIDKDTRELFVDHVGTYSIVFEYSDVFEYGTSSYTFTSLASTDCAYNPIALPKYFISGASYTLDSVYATDFSQFAPKNLEVQYQVSINGGDFAAVNYKNFVPSEDTTTVQFKYIYGANAMLSNVIKVIDVDFDKNNLVTTNYFQSEDASYYAYGGDDGKTFAFKLNDGVSSAVIDFVNPVSLKAFNLDITVPTVLKNVSYVNIILTDYANQANSVTIKYQPMGSKYLMSLSNGLTAEGSTSFVGTSMALSYSPKYGSFLDANIGQYLAWNNNFSGDRVLVTFEVGSSDVTQSAGILFNKLVGVTLNRTNRDQQEPIVAFSTESMGTQVKNSNAYISSLEGSDVFCPGFFIASNSKLTVTSPSLSNPIALDGTTLLNADATKDYEISLSELGIYTITYKYTDQKGRTGSGSFQIEVADDVKPTITIDGGYNELTVIEAKVGDTITAKSYTVSDNFDGVSDLTVGIAVLTPHQNLYDLTENGFEFENMKFVCEYKGIYTIYYYVQDTSGNYSSTCYKISVS